MKKILFIMLMMVFSFLTISAQSISGTAVYDAPGSSRSSYIATPYRYNGVANDTIFINSKNGRCIVHRISQTSRKKYNKPIPEETAKLVARNMGISYTYQKKSK